MTTTTTAAPEEFTKRLLPWMVAIAFFILELDTTILNTAVPAMLGEPVPLVVGR